MIPNLRTFLIEGDKVIGGTINLEGSIVIKVEKVGSDMCVSQIIELVRRAQEAKSRMQDLANRATMWLTLIALIGGALTFLTWTLILGDIIFSLERAVTVMVITCPHALGLAVPLVIAKSTSISAMNGFLIRNRTAFENARRIQVVVFGKIGTLTEDRFGVINVIPISNDINEKEIVRLAASLEKNSEHPIAQGIMNYALDQGLKLYEVKDFKAISGRGVEGIINNHKVMIVGSGYLKENNITINNTKLIEVFNQGETVVFLIVDGKIMGAIALADILRKESYDAIRELKKMGIKCMMLTGDDRYVAK